VEELGAQKMMLEDRVSQLQATVEDLEVRARCGSRWPQCRLTCGRWRMSLQVSVQTLRELNEELEENHLATEKQLQDEVDFKDTIIRTQVRAAKHCEWHYLMVVPLK